MSPIAIRIGKAATLLFWLVVGANIVTPFPGAWHQGLLIAGIATALAHALECLVFSRRVQVQPSNKALHYLLILVYGYFHAVTLPDPGKTR